jgi:hypothetical protein
MRPLTGGHRIPGIDEGFKSSTGADLGLACGQIVAKAAHFAMLRVGFSVGMKKIA